MVKQITWLFVTDEATTSNERNMFENRVEMKVVGRYSKQNSRDKGDGLKN